MIHRAVGTRRSSACESRRGRCRGPDGSRGLLSWCRCCGSLADVRRAPGNVGSADAAGRSAPSLRVRKPSARKRDPPMAMSAEETMPAAEGGALSTAATAALPDPSSPSLRSPASAPPSPASAPPARVELFGVPVDALTLDQTVARCRQLVAEGGVHQHVVLNAAKVVELTHNEELRDVIASCDVINADGASVVWAGKVLRHPLPERVAGIDLFEALVAAASEDGRSVYFLGARPEVVAEVVEVMRDRHPALEVAGYRDGYWRDDAEVVAEVRAAAPDYLFLAIPSPRKEFWLHRWLDQLGVPLVMGVGGSFDVVTGTTTRAPMWMQRAGLEWAWRLGQEPRRMWKRYLVGNSKFVWLTAREAVKGRRG